MYSGFSLPASKMVAKIFSNSSQIIQWGLLSPFQGSLTHTEAYGGLRNHTLAFYWNFE